MIKDILENRYTCTNWSDEPISMKDLHYVLTCAYNAPGKMGLCGYNAIVLYNSENAVKIKNWLYKEHGWNRDGERQNKLGNQKVFVGQYSAPALIVWISQSKPVELVERNVDGIITKQKTPDKSQQVHNTFISMTCAMLAAQELGYQTGIANCFDSIEIAKKLGYEKGVATVALGIGKAANTNNAKRVNDSVLKVIDDQGKLEGIKLDNITPDKKDHFNRVHRPSFSEVFKVLE